jgi:hypothetical protein
MEGEWRRPCCLASLDSYMGDSYCGGLTGSVPDAGKSLTKVCTKTNKSNIRFRQPIRQGLFNCFHQDAGRTSPEPFLQGFPAFLFWLAAKVWALDVFPKGEPLLKSPIQSFPSRTDQD